MNWRASRVGWAGLVTYVIAWDYLMSTHEGSSLTYGFQSAKARHQRAALATVWGVTTLHLFGVLPKRVDPFHWAGRTFGRNTYATISRTADEFRC